VNIKSIKVTEHIYYGYSKWAKSPKKQSERVRFYVNSVLKRQCHVDKNTLLQIAFSAILLTVIMLTFQGMALN